MEQQHLGPPGQHLDRQIPVWVSLFVFHEVWLLLGAFTPFPHPSLASSLLSEAFSSKALLWFQYDALFYVHIAHHGYGPHPSAFYPLLPALIWLLRSRWVALLVMQGVFAADLYFLSQYFENLHLTHRQVGIALALFAFNPAAVFYTTLYTEPLTVLFSVLSLMAALSQKYFYAALTAGLAALSHPTGILVGVMPLVLLGQSLHRRDAKTAQGAVIWGIGIIIGLGLYVLYSLVHWHAPLAPWQGEAGWHSRWIWPWEQYTFIWKALSSPILRIYVTLLAILSIPYLIGGFLLVRNSSKETIPTAVYAWTGIFVSLCFYAMHQPFHSTLRLLSPYFPLYAGIALIKKPVYVMIIVILWMIAGLYGAVLFTHQWWWQ